MIVPGSPVERQQLAVDALGFFRSNAKRLDCTLDFVARGGERLAGLERNAAGEIESVVLDAMSDVLENGRAAPCGQSLRLGKSILGGTERLVGIAAGGLADGGDDVVVIGAAHLGGGFAVAEIARDDERSSCRRSLSGGPLRF